MFSPTRSQFLLRGTQVVISVEFVAMESKRFPLLFILESLSMRVRPVLIALFASLFLLAGQSAKAFDGFGGLGGGIGYGFGYGIGIGGLYNGLDRPSDYRVPYFAAHPPVYYSYPVPRTYGHSPFAYPPHFATPEIACQAAAPVTIINPHAPTSTQPATQKDQDETVSAPAKPGPLVIHNPFATPSTYAASDR